MLIAFIVQHRSALIRLSKNISRNIFWECIPFTVEHILTGNQTAIGIMGWALLPCHISWGPGSGGTCCSERSVWLRGLWYPYTIQHPRSLWYCCTGLWLSALWAQEEDRGTGRQGRRDREKKKKEKVLVWQPFSCKCSTIVLPRRRSEIQDEIRASHLASCDT